jgi:hypothetical protein
MSEKVEIFLPKISLDEVLERAQEDQAAEQAIFSFCQASTVSTLVKATGERVRRGGEHFPSGGKISQKVRDG